ncbi:hypothetical protein HT749_06665 [Burkholderia cepacia]|uniref:hypothetical protein n=1 Tax=Burkholderia cepacia TaxID=292 RepID=UPI00157A59D8|nr:hypothetical protein [Burkholderia cepacia]NTX43079.1 hypothetical protein [Burkholderia cepacia]
MPSKDPNRRATVYADWAKRAKTTHKRRGLLVPLDLDALLVTYAKLNGISVPDAIVEAVERVHGAGLRRAAPVENGEA